MLLIKTCWRGFVAQASWRMMEIARGGFWRFLGRDPVSVTGTGDTGGAETLASLTGGRAGDTELRSIEKGFSPG